MNKILSGLMASTLVASFAVASVMPAEAGPVFVPKTTEAVQTNAQNVDYYVYRRGDSGRVYHRNWRAERRDRYMRRHAWRDRYYSDDPYYHSAYRYHHRRHWRDNYWRRDDPGVRLEFSF
jgi:hypothetical protein